MSNLKCVGASTHPTLAIQATNSFLGSIGRDNKIQTQFPYMLLLIIYS
ncbi:Uncharacterised protein [Kingella kingae]|uniref:Uncharacterized protein n=1 Tax=Kingella kingae TaxID=504 RepID=A0AAX2IZH4_KINKI|nr:Uncharacterised protein [Kingella kingae]STR01423.1 Uncharacterised protein [Kingella kingae]